MAQKRAILRARKLADITNHAPNPAREGREKWRSGSFFFDTKNILGKWSVLPKQPQREERREKMKQLCGWIYTSSLFFICYAWRLNDKSLRRDVIKRHDCIWHSYKQR